MSYTARTFDLPELTGLSSKQIEVHLGLYKGYVTNVNLLTDTVAAYQQTDDAGGKYAIAEMRRRLGFEFDGMRMHEYYFEQLEGDAAAPSTDGALTQAATEKYGSWDGFITHIKDVAGMRGIGWTIVYFDPSGSTLHTAWIDDHQIGQLAGLPVVLAVDMWEHAYMVDYVPADKKNYVSAFLENVNWGVVEARFASAA